MKIRKIAIFILVVVLMVSILNAGKLRISIKVETTEATPAFKEYNTQIKFPPVKIKGGLRPKVWTDKDTYCTNEDAWIYFRMNKDPYVFVFIQNPEGSVDVLWPTRASGLFKIGRVKGGVVYRLPIRKPYKMSKVPGTAKIYIVAFREEEVPEKLIISLGTYSSTWRDDVIRIPPGHWNSLIWTNTVGRHDIAWNWAVHEVQIVECAPPPPPELTVLFKDNFNDNNTWPWRVVEEAPYVENGELFPFNPVFLPMYIDPMSHYRIEFDFRMNESSKFGLHFVSDSYDRTNDFLPYRLYSFEFMNDQCECFKVLMGPEGNELFAKGMDLGTKKHHMSIEHVLGECCKSEWIIKIDGNTYRVADPGIGEFIGYFLFEGGVHIDNFELYVYTR